MTELILFQIVLEIQMNAIELHTNIICYQKVSMSFLCDLFIFLFYYHLQFIYVIISLNNLSHGQSDLFKLCELILKNVRR